MDQLYSWALLVALVAGAAGILLGALPLLGRTSKASPEGRTGRVALGLVLLGGVSLAISVGVHGRWGHGPASAEPMDIARFATAHPAFFVAGFVLIGALGVIGYARKRPRGSRAA